MEDLPDADTAAESAWPHQAWPGEQP